MGSPLGCSHLNKGVVVSHCDFSFHFPNDLLMLSIFSFACIHPSIFGEMSVQRFYPLLLFFKLGCCSYDFKIFLYYESERSLRVGAMSALIKITAGALRHSTCPGLSAFNKCSVSFE